MRDLIISIVCMLLLLIPWSIYDNYSVQTISWYRTTIEDQILPAIQGEDWDLAERSFSEIQQNWDRYQKVSAFFLDTQSINEIDSILSKAEYYLALHDPSNAAGEIAYLKNCFDLLHENQSPSMGNIL